MTKAQATLGMFLEVGEIELTGLNPRRDFDDAGLKELAASINAHGIIEPLVVTTDHRLIAGERRLKAAKMIGMKTVPVVVMDVDDDELPEIMLIENLQRKDLNCVEEAAGVAALLSKGMTQDELAVKIGRSQSWVSTRSRIAMLPMPLKELAAAGKLGAEALIELTPFLDYPILEGLTKTVLAVNKRDKPVEFTQSGVKDIIENRLDTGDDALNLEPDQWDREHEVLKLMNRKGCKGCPHIVKRKTEYQGKTVHCLNKECWEPRLQDAEKKLKEREEAKAKKLKASAGSGSHPPSAQDYRPLTKEADDWREPEFDRSECSSCEDKIMATRGKRKVGRCSKPSCWEKKQKAAKTDREQRMKATATAIEKNLDKVLEGRPFGPNEQRFVLGVMAKLSIGIGDNPLKNWVKRPGEDWRVSIKGIPKEAIGECMLRIVIRKEANSLVWPRGDTEATIANLREYFPELLDGIVQERLPEKAKRGKAEKSDAEDLVDDDPEDEDPEEG